MIKDRAVYIDDPGTAAFGNQHPRLRRREKAPVALPLVAAEVPQVPVPGSDFQASDVDCEPLTASLGDYLEEGRDAIGKASDGVYIRVQHGPNQDVAHERAADPASRAYYATPAFGCRDDEFGVSDSHVDDQAGSFRCANQHRWPLGSRLIRRAAFGNPALDADRLDAERLRDALQCRANMVKRARIANDEYVLPGLQVAHLPIDLRYDGENVRFEPCRDVWGDKCHGALRPLLSLYMEYKLPFPHRQPDARIHTGRHLMSDFRVTRRRIVEGLMLGALVPVRRLGRAAEPMQRPNIVFILADDLGYGDLSVYGQTDYQTPNLDRLATHGVRLTQAYANSAVCSATRIALITGRYQYRLPAGLAEPIRDASDHLGLPPNQPTLPSLLRAAGYATALFGKWHMGFLPRFGPLKSGYDVFFGNYGGDIDYFTHRPDADPTVPEDLYEGETPVHELGYYTRLLSDRACEYIGMAPLDRPFLLSLHFTAPHWPWEGPDDESVSREIKEIIHYDGGNLATYGKMVMDLDAAVGRVLQALDDRGLSDDTIVIFTSDNGGERFSRMWPFSGQKTELLEGGLRVPAFMRWPGRVPAGSVSSQVAISMDWLPTLLSAANAASDPRFPSDGIDLLPILRGEHSTVERTLFWRYKRLRQRAVRSGNWKYLKINDNEFLFDVAVDQRERANLAQKHPQVFADLKRQWGDWNRTMLPSPRSAYSHGVSPRHQADHYRPDEED